MRIAESLYLISCFMNHETHNLYVIYHDDAKSKVSFFVLINYHMLTWFPVVLEASNFVYRLLIPRIVEN